MPGPLAARIPLGPSGLEVSPICLGANVFGWTADLDASIAVLDAFVEHGGNFIDTANIYSGWIPGNLGGESETIIGHWLQQSGKRDQMVIATKVGMASGMFEKGLSRDHIRRGIEGSLARLQIDTIDLYYAHEDDADTPLTETMGAFDELAREGLVRAVGSSNYSAARLAEALQVSADTGVISFSVHEPHFNLLDRDGYDGALEQLCRERGLGVAPYYALARGFLSGKYRPHGPIPAGSRAAGIERDYMNPRGWGMLETVDGVAAAHGVSQAQVAIAWLMARPSITSPIVSATTPAQLAELAGAIAVGLTADDIAALDAAGAR
jgi:aryl-alcohol dehydrogenase-like predicted oxidoreductase